VGNATTLSDRPLQAAASSNVPLASTKRMIVRLVFRAMLRPYDYFGLVA
jgi:hypothetical protein